MIQLERIPLYLDEAGLLARLAEAGFVTTENPLPLEKIALGGRAPRDCRS